MPAPRATVVSARRALAVLHKIDPEARKQFTRDIKDAAAPMVADARAHVPNSAPAAWWSSKSRLAWSSKARSGIKIKLGGKRLKSGEIPLATFVQVDAAGAIFGDAGTGRIFRKTARGRAFVAKLNAEHGSGPRVLTPAAERHIGTVRAAVVQSLDAVAARINRM